jgi:hypothetical protein
MMTHAFASAALIAGLIAAVPASAQPAPAGKCYDCPQPRDHYDTQETIRTTRDVDHSRVIETQSEVRVPAYAPRRTKPALRARAECVDCPKPRDHYDTQETIRNSTDVDHSRVIETQSEVPVSRKVKEHNHLIIRENETRNVGVIQHNHTIIERERRYVVRVPSVITVNYVTQQYRVVETPATVTVPVEYRPVRRCHGKRYGRYDYESCRPLLRVRG